MAICKCKNGHTWTTRVLEDDPSTNSMTVEFEIIGEDEED